MADSPSAKSAILYQNHSRTVVLIDIPTSIALAQTASEYRALDVLVSSEPLRQPYSSIEPKSESARARLLQQSSSEEQEHHSELQKYIQTALRDIKQTYKGDWCLPRRVSSVKVNQSRPQKRKSDRLTMSLDESPPGQRPLELAFHTYDLTNDSVSSQTRSPYHLKSADDENEHHFANLSSIYNRVVHNDDDIRTRIVIDTKHKFRIPPLSTFILSSIENSLETLKSAAMTSLCDDSLSANTGQFDFILADPPWANRSVRRAKKYKTSENHQIDPWELVQMVLGQHLNPGGLVGIWITNKPDSRKKVRTAFKTWGIQLVEEWVWVKTTIQGEPVTELDGLWRKPYEILLLGRKSYIPRHEVSGSEQSVVNKRIICGVPDLHSRKPSLKELIEPLMPDPLDYRALEVFARNLTAGWWTWGDEVLKFNWEGNWVIDD